MVTYGCMLFEGAINVLMVATMSMLQDHFEMSAASISTLITIKSIGTVATIYFSGSLSDLIGRKNIICLGSVFFMVFLIGLISTQNFYMAMFFALIGGIAHGLMDSPAISMLIDIFGRDSGPAMSFVQVFFASGSAITSTLTSLIIKKNMNWKLIYALYAIVGIVVIAIVLTARYPKRYKGEPIDANESPKREPSFMREGLLLACTTFLLSSSSAVINTWLPTFANQEKNMTLISSVELLAKLQFGNIVGALLFAYILTKVHATVLLIINPLIALIGMMTIVFMPNISALSVFVVGMVMGVLFSLALNIAGEMFPQSSGKATGFIGSASMSAGMTTVFLTGKLYPYTGFQHLFTFVLILLSLAICLATWFRTLYLKMIKGDL